MRDGMPCDNTAHGVPMHEDVFSISSREALPNIELKGE